MDDLMRSSTLNSIDGIGAGNKRSILFRNLQCQWPSCGLTCLNYTMFVEHLIEAHRPNELTYHQVSMKAKIINLMRQQLREEEEMFEAMSKYLDSIRNFDTEKADMKTLQLRNRSGLVGTGAELTNPPQSLPTVYPPLSSASQSVASTNHPSLFHNQNSPSASTTHQQPQLSLFDHYSVSDSADVQALLNLPAITNYDFSRQQKDRPPAQVENIMGDQNRSLNHSSVAEIHEQGGSSSSSFAGVGRTTSTSMRYSQHDDRRPPILSASHINNDNSGGSIMINHPASASHPITATQPQQPANIALKTSQNSSLLMTPGSLSASSSTWATNSPNNTNNNNTGSIPISPPAANIHDKINKGAVAAAPAYCGPPDGGPPTLLTTGGDEHGPGPDRFGLMNLRQLGEQEPTRNRLLNAQFDFATAGAPNQSPSAVLGTRLQLPHLPAASCEGVFSPKNDRQQQQQQPQQKLPSLSFHRPSLAPTESSRSQEAEATATNDNKNRFYIPPFSSNSNTPSSAAGLTIDSNDFNTAGAAAAVSSSARSTTRHFSSISTGKSMKSICLPSPSSTAQRKLSHYPPTSNSTTGRPLSSTSTSSNRLQLSAARHHYAMPYHPFYNNPNGGKLGRLRVIPYPPPMPSMPPSASQKLIDIPHVGSDSQLRAPGNFNSPQGYSTSAANSSVASAATTRTHHQHPPLLSPKDRFRMESNHLDLQQLAPPAAASHVLEASENEGRAVEYHKQESSSSSIKEVIHNNVRSEPPNQRQDPQRHDFSHQHGILHTAASNPPHNDYEDDDPPPTLPPVTPPSPSSSSSSCTTTNARNNRKLPYPSPEKSATAASLTTGTTNDPSTATKSATTWGTHLNLTTDGAVSSVTTTTRSAGGKELKILNQSFSTASTPSNAPSSSTPSVQQQANVMEVDFEEEYEPQMDTAAGGCSVDFPHYYQAHITHNNNSSASVKRKPAADGEDEGVDVADTDDNGVNLHEVAKDLELHRELYRKENVRPKHSYCALICQAILESHNRRLRLSDIYDWFTDNFAYFRQETRLKWKSGIRHNLSLRGCFARISGKYGSHWELSKNAGKEAFKLTRKNALEADNQRSTATGLADRQHLPSKSGTTSSIKIIADDGDGDQCRQAKNRKVSSYGKEMEKTNNAGNNKNNKMLIPTPPPFHIPGDPNTTTFLMTADDGKDDQHDHNVVGRSSEYYVLKDNESGGPAQAKTVTDSNHHSALSQQAAAKYDNNTSKSSNSFVSSQSSVSGQKETDTTSSAHASGIESEQSQEPSHKTVPSTPASSASLSSSDTNQSSTTILSTNSTTRIRPFNLSDFSPEIIRAFNFPAQPLPTPKLVRLPLITGGSTAAALAAQNSSSAASFTTNTAPSLVPSQQPTSYPSNTET